MNLNQNFIFHKKSKSINNKLSLKDFDCDNNLISVQVNTNNFIFNNDLKNRTNVITEDKNEDKEDMVNNINTNTSAKNDSEKIDELNFIKTIDDMKQNVLDYYYDKNSAFKQKIDNLNLKFYLETEKYLNNSKKNDNNRNQKLQANLFIILFQQINVFIEEIERLNKIILDNKYKKEQILLRTTELNEKKNDILLKDNLIQSLKQSNTNTEKKLLETLLNEDKLMKDNQRLRKENETYKTLTIVFENELKNTMKKSGLTPQKNKVAKHIKTYSDYGVPTNSIINELSGYNNAFALEENYDTINNDIKYTTARNNEKDSNNDNYMTNKNNFSLNSLLVDKKLKSSESNKYAKFNKIGKSSTLTENNSIRDKKIINKNIINTNRIKLKQSQDNKVKLKKDIYNFSKIENKNILHKKNNNSNLSSNFAYNKNASIKRKKLNVIIKKKNNAMNIDSTLNNMNSLINSNNTNIMTEANNNTSFEIECIDPYDTELRLYSTPYKIRFSKEEVLCNYLDLINIYSQFEDADIAIKFNRLSRTIDEGMHGGRGRKPMKLTYEDILDMIKYFKSYYENLGEDKDKLLSKKIREAVNGSLDYLKKRLDFDKIE